jgi:hypothetical protein
MPRPTIAELEKILQNEQEVEIEILPNGEVRAKGQTTALEVGPRKPLTIKENLGGEYSESNNSYDKRSQNSSFVEIQILSNGELRAKGKISHQQVTIVKALTIREDLGGEYGESVLSQ